MMQISVDILNDVVKPGGLKALICVMTYFVMNIDTLD